MIKVNMYSIYDRKAKVYNAPYFLVNDEVAIRQFDSMVKNPETMISKYPEDYILYNLGEFDTLNGNIEIQVPPVEICQGLHLARR